MLHIPRVIAVGVNHFAGLQHDGQRSETGVVTVRLR